MDLRKSDLSEALKKQFANFLRSKRMGLATDRGELYAPGNRARPDPGDIRKLEQGFISYSVLRDALGDLGSVAGLMGPVEDINVMCIGNPSDSPDVVWQLVLVLRMAFLFSARRVVLWEKMVYASDQIAQTHQKEKFIPRKKALELMSDGLRVAVGLANAIYVDD